MSFCFKSQVPRTYGRCHVRRVRCTQLWMALRNKAWKGSGCGWKNVSWQGSQGRQAGAAEGVGQGSQEKFQQGLYIHYIEGAFGSLCQQGPQPANIKQGTDSQASTHSPLRNLCVSFSPELTGWPLKSKHFPHCPHLPLLLISPSSNTNLRAKGFWEM